MHWIEVDVERGENVVLAVYLPPSAAETTWQAAIGEAGSEVTFAELYGKGPARIELSPPLETSERRVVVRAIAPAMAAGS
jgi:hypothetical protein